MIRGLEIQYPWWEIAAPKSYWLFFRHVTESMPMGSILHVEGTSFSTSVAAFLQSNALSVDVRIARGTIWPRPKKYDLPLDPSVTHQLERLCEHNAAPEICDHLHVHDGKQVFLSWFDFPFDPFFIAVGIGERSVRRLAEVLGVTCFLPCSRCNYDLTGNESGVCPECGEAI